MIRIDPRSRAVVAGIDVPGAIGHLAVGEGSVWVVNVAGDTVAKIDPERGRVVDTFGVGAGPGAIAVADGAVWVANLAGKSLSKISVVSGQVETIPVPGRPAGLTVVDDAGHLWAVLLSPTART